MNRSSTAALVHCHVLPLAATAAATAFHSSISIAHCNPHDRQDSIHISKPYRQRSRAIPTHEGMIPNTDRDQVSHKLRLRFRLSTACTAVAALLCCAVAALQQLPHRGHTELKVSAL